MKLDIRQAAISLGAVFGIVHFATVLLITLSGGALSGWWMTTHHVRAQYMVEPLNAGLLIVGTVVAAIIGAAIGALFAVIWNSIEKSG